MSHHLRPLSYKRRELLKDFKNWAYVCYKGLDGDRGKNEVDGLQMETRGPARKQCSGSDEGE